jgi:hypothetical protein
VNHNLDSQRLQYAMQDRLHHLGWREVDVVDEDLGRSAAGTVTRRSKRLPCVTNSPFLLVRISASARLTVCSGCFYGGCDPGGAKR